METFHIQSLTFRYPNQCESALDRVTLNVRQGEFLVLCGPSGGGKTTLLKNLKPALTPRGRREGEVLFEGRPLEALDLREQSAKIGFVMQDPDNQIVTDKVWHELAFGLESLGYATPVIRRRVAEMASFFGIEDWFYRDVASLSGGQKQLLNLACVMAMQPKVLLLDEPTAQLDPIAAADFLAIVAKINRELSVTVMLTEHRLEEALPLASRAIVLERGRVIADGTPSEVGEMLLAQGHPMFSAMPTPMRVWAAVKSPAPCPVTVREGRNWLEAHLQSHEPVGVAHSPERDFSREKPVLKAERVWFRYERVGPDVLKGLSLSLHRGELFALLGVNGAGKSTAVRLLSGLEGPTRGEILREGSVGVLPQNPKALFIKKTVREELLDAISSLSGEKSFMLRKLKDFTELCQLDALLDRHPYDLSGGEQQRAALCKVLLREPDILLLDEPTKGLDAQFKETLAEILRALRQRSKAILLVSHDIEFCAACADTCALLFDGEVVASGSPDEFFAGNAFYTTAASRMSRGLLPECVTPRALISALEGKEEEPVHPDVPPPLLPPDEPPPFETPQKPKIPEMPEKLPTRSKALALCSVLLLILLTLYFGAALFDGRKYSFIALLVLLECTLPFFVLFEGRKPKARELAVIAALCAIGVAGRAAFFMLPQFKPVMALAIIAGVAFGGETGFLTGAMTMLVSNMLFAQGPWTPWQMFAMGLTGFLAGTLFRTGPLRRTRAALCAYGGLAALLVYGPVMNFASALLWQGSVNLPVFLAYSATGFPMDAIHAAGTVVFLWFAAEPMLEKLERIKIKYGVFS
ncbi:MAG TPA: ATP-binding cassette domain-containing protein [Candidatus Acidoferrum sp.]|nr:ATP-binding cassette domain-containing protein [Candidatus Acidoferrum sp.]